MEARMGRVRSPRPLNKAVAAWDGEKLEGRYWGPGTVVRLETTIKDLDSLRLATECSRPGGAGLTTASWVSRPAVLPLGQSFLSVTTISG